MVASLMTLHCESLFDDLDGTIDAGAKSAWIGQKDQKIGFHVIRGAWLSAAVVVPRLVGSRNEASSIQTLPEQRKVLACRYMGTHIDSLPGSYAGS